MDAIFELIKNLSKSEKSFFTKYSSVFANEKSPTYLKLFKAIDKQDVYDEKKLAKKLNIKNYAYHKHYLYEQLLTAIKLFHDKHSDKKKVLHYIEVADVLMRKRLLEQAERLVEKAAKIAKKEMDGALLARVLQMRMELLKAPKDLELLKSRGESLIDETYQVSQIFQDQMTLNHLIIQMLYIIRKGYPNKHPEATKTMMKILQHELIQDETKCISFYDKTNRLILLNIVYSWLNEHEKSYAAKMEHLRIYEERPDIIKFTPVNYLTPLNNIINGAIQLGKIGEAIIFIKKLQEFHSELKVNSQVKNVAQSHLVLCIFKLFAKAHNRALPNDLYSEGLQLLEDLKRTNIRDTNNAFCHFYIAQYQFLKGNYEATLEATRNFSLLDNNNKKFMYYKLISDFFDAICLIEANANETAESLITSLHKRRLKDEIFTPYLVSFIETLKKGINKPLNKAKFKVFEESEISEHEAALQYWVLETKSK